MRRRRELNQPDYGGNQMTIRELVTNRVGSGEREGNVVWGGVGALAMIIRV